MNNAVGCNEIITLYRDAREANTQLKKLAKIEKITKLESSQLDEKLFQTEYGAEWFRKKVQHLIQKVDASYKSDT